MMKPPDPNAPAEPLALALFNPAAVLPRGVTRIYPEHVADAIERLPALLDEIAAAINEAPTAAAIGHALDWVIDINAFSSACLDVFESGSPRAWTVAVDPEPADEPGEAA